MSVSIKRHETIVLTDPEHRAVYEITVERFSDPSLKPEVNIMRRDTVRYTTLGAPFRLGDENGADLREIIRLLALEFLRQQL